MAKHIYRISLQVEAEDSEEALLVADYILENALMNEGSMVNVVEIEDVTKQLSLAPNSTKDQI